MAKNAAPKHALFTGANTGSVTLDDTLATIARFAPALTIIGLPRLPGGRSDDPAFARLADLF